MKSMNRLGFRWRYLLIALGLSILVLLVRDFNNRMMELRRLTVERDHRAATVTSLVSTRSYLETQVALATAGLLYEQIAREQLQYSDPEDFTIELQEAPAETQQADQPSLPVIEPVARWELWLALFIDPDVLSADDILSSFSNLPLDLSGSP
jgi:cell division protein FtsB